MEVWRLEESELQNALFTPSHDYMIVAAARICTCKFGKDCLPTHLTYATGQDDHFLLSIQTA